MLLAAAGACLEVPRLKSIGIGRRLLCSGQALEARKWATYGATSLLDCDEGSSEMRDATDPSQVGSKDYDVYSARAPSESKVSAVSGPSSSFCRK